jgi:hypothetical protein
MSQNGKSELSIDGKCELNLFKVFSWTICKIKQKYSLVTLLNFTSPNVLFKIDQISICLLKLFIICSIPKKRNRSGATFYDMREQQKNFGNLDFQHSKRGKMTFGSNITTLHVKNVQTMICKHSAAFLAKFLQKNANFELSVRSCDASQIEVVWWLKNYASCGMWPTVQALHIIFECFKKH